MNIFSRQESFHTGIFLIFSELERKTPSQTAPNFAALQLCCHLPHPVYPDSTTHEVCCAAAPLNAMRHDIHKCNGVDLRTFVDRMSQSLSFVTFQVRTSAFPDTVRCTQRRFLDVWQTQALSNYKYPKNGN